jgi:hypothetical protein
MTQVANATFQIKSYEEVPYSEIPGGPTLAKGHFVFTYQGDIQGEGVYEELKIYYAENQATMYGLQRVIARVGGKFGSFVLEHQGQFENGIVTCIMIVVPGSGTGELKGIRGQVQFQSAHAQEFPISLAYSLG